MATQEQAAGGDARWETGDSLSESNLNTTDVASNTADYVEAGCEFSLSGSDLTIGDGSGSNFARVKDGTTLYKLYPDQTTVTLPNGSGVNHVYVAYGDVDGDGVDEVYYHADDDDTPPSDPSLKIGTADTSGGTVTELNRNPSSTVRALVLEDTA